MLRLQFLLLLLTPGLLHSQGTEVTFTVKQVSPHCGGDELGPEEMAALRKPNPLAGKAFIIRKGKRNDVKKPVVASIKTDSKGIAMVRLEPGEYVLVDSVKKDRKRVKQILKDFKKPTTDY